MRDTSREGGRKTSCMQCSYRKCIEQSCICTVQHIACSTFYSGTVSFSDIMGKEEESLKNHPILSN